MRVRVWRIELLALPGFSSPHHGCPEPARGGRGSGVVPSATGPPGIARLAGPPLQKWLRTHGHAPSCRKKWPIAFFPRASRSRPVMAVTLWTG